MHSQRFVPVLQGFFLPISSGCDSVHSISTILYDRDGLPSPGRVKNFLSSMSSRPALESTQPIQWVPGSLSPGVNRPKHETDHLPPTSAKIKKNIDLYIYSHIRLHGIVLN
jgi:hypothetical protein